MLSAKWTTSLSNLLYYMSLTPWKWPGNLYNLTLINPTKGGSAPLNPPESYCSNSTVMQVSARPDIRSACSFANTATAPGSHWWSLNRSLWFAVAIVGWIWSLELKTILRTPYYDFVLRMNDWPDGVSICQWDSRKQLESRIENNSPYSLLWLGLEKRRTDEMEYQSTNEIHENKCSL
jgi:hypothetical protein